MDEGYFTIEASEHQHKTQKARRSSKTKSNVMVMAESTILENIETGKVERKCRYFKVKILESHQADYVELHISEISNKKNNERTT